MDSSKFLTSGCNDFTVSIVFPVWVSALATDLVVQAIPEWLNEKFIENSWSHLELSNAGYTPLLLISVNLF